MIGIFLVAAASAGRTQQQVATALTGVPAEELMSHPAICIPSGLTLADAGEQYFARYRYTAFPVIDAHGRIAGLLSIERVEQTPHSDRASTFAGERADTDRALLLDKREDVAHLLERPGFARVGRATVIDDSRHPLGVVSITDIQRAIRATRLHDTPSRQARLAPR